jgi:urea transport system ATP-binding protein
MLTVDHIDLHYGASRALWGVALKAKPGEITCVLGRNGVGKTSTMRVVAGHARPSKGRIVWEGQDITSLRPYERARRGIALVPQGREIFPLLTVQENLETGFGVLPRRERKVTGELFDLFPMLKSFLKRRGGDLSGGQQQQLAIARALVTKPRLLLLDEPTEGIQPSIIKDIGRVLSMLRQRGDMAILLVEQYFEFAKELADKLVVMERGEVVMSGPTADLDAAAVRRYMTV